jgi:hypothetical protein
VRLVAAGDVEGNVAERAVWQIGWVHGQIGGLARNGEFLTIIRVRQTSPMGVLAAIIRSGTGALPASSPVRRGVPWWQVGRDANVRAL